MNATANFQAAIEREIVWKNDELKTFCLELVERALASDEPHFTTDIVPDEVRGSGSGIAGSAAHILKTASVIEHVGHEHGGKDNIFDLVNAAVAVGLNTDAFVGISAFAEEPADEMMQDSIGADPIAKNATQ